MPDFAEKDYYEFVRDSDDKLTYQIVKTLPFFELQKNALQSNIKLSLTLQKPYTYRQLLNFLGQRKIIEM